ncbi:SSX2IP [Acanthosepion pharaonis]|uniref:SSX2IP n=1 Tax=Acanthosepion pharaonis TaxID=158019 RepID=A0A812BTD5_ACAPH|nr:SSX2IP [Sepia pharaonis]
MLSDGVTHGARIGDKVYSAADGFQNRMDNNHENHSFAMQLVNEMNNSHLSEWDMHSPSFQSLTNSRLCTEDNVDEYITYLNKVFRNMCLSSWIDEEQNQTVSLVNACFELIERYQQDSRIREDLEARTRRTMSDYDQLQTAQLRLKEDVERLEREIALRQEKEKDLASKNRNLSSAIKSEKDEVKRLQSVINHRESQYKHESKKKERESNRLKEKLNQVLMDKSQKLIGNEVINILPKTDTKRGTWKTTSKPEELYKLMLRNYEEKQKEMMQENLDLRSCLATIQQQLHSIVECYKARLRFNSGSLDSSCDESSSFEDDNLEDLNDKFQKVVCNGEVTDINPLPFEMSKEEILKNFNKACHILMQLLKRKLKESEKISMTLPSPVVANNSHTELEVQLSELRKEVDEYKDIIELQDQVLRKRSFHDEKFQQLKQQILDLTPQRGRNRAKNSSYSKEYANRILPMTPSQHSANQKPNKSDIYETIDLCQNHFQNRSKCSLENVTLPDSTQSSSSYCHQYVRSQSCHESFQHSLPSTPIKDHHQNTCLLHSSSYTSPSCRRQSAPIKSVSNPQVICNNPSLQRNVNFTSLTSLNDKMYLPECLPRIRSHSVDDQCSSQTQP